jgi:hypothetical protein
MANDEEGRFLVNVCFLDINVGIKTVLYLWQTLIHGVLFYTATMHRALLYQNSPLFPQRMDSACTYSLIYIKFKFLEEKF